MIGGEGGEVVKTGHIEYKLLRSVTSRALRLDNKQDWLRPRLTVSDQSRLTREMLMINEPNAPIEPIAQELSGIFIIDLKNFRLSQSQLIAINNVLQETVQTELAKLDDIEGPSFSRLGGTIAGFMAR